MKQQFISEEKEELTKICSDMRELIKEENFQACDLLLKAIISKYPHAPEPHNLYGILFEKQGDHIYAMKHFRAAWDLDSTYLPARFNLDQYGNFYSKGIMAFDESDCPELKQKSSYKIEYDENRIGRISRGKSDGTKY